MLTALAIENFKGISERVEIEFRPLTLLFGPNNAGKSTVLHAIHYLYELLIHNNVDADVTTLGGGSVNLGGFRSLVNGQDVDKLVTLRATLDISARIFRARKFGLREQDFLNLDLDDDVETVWLEVLVSQHRIERVTVGLNDNHRPLAIADTDSGGGSFTLDTTHPCFRVHDAEPEIDQELNDLALLNRVGNRWSWPLPAADNVMNAMGEPLFSRLREQKIDDRDSDEDDRRAEQQLIGLERVLSGVVSSILAGIKRWLRQTIYAGPLRTIPSRNFRPQTTPSPGRWADGEAAWDALHSAPQLEQANQWFERLGLNLRGELFRRVEVPDRPSNEIRNLRNKIAHSVTPTSQELSSLLPILNALNQQYFECVLRIFHGTNKLQPSDLGVGVSQVVPVVVAATYGSRASSMIADGQWERAPYLVMMEQPELHVHPAIQVGLGDLFLESRKSRQFILETHSEHLLLRMLRRIEETTGGDLPANVQRVRADEVCVIYVDGSGGQTRFQRLRIDDSGEFIDPWPTGFFGEREAELF